MPYEAYFESAAESLIVVDREGRIVHVNAAAHNLFGYQAGELDGQPIELLIPDRFRGVHETHRSGYMEAPRSRPMGIGLDLSAKRKDGREFPVEVSLTFVRRDKEEYVICLVTDISIRLAREREARRADMLRTLGSIAASVAHDLNNPLTVILSRIELMTTLTADLPGEIRADLEVVHRHAQRASRITQDLLALARQRPKAHEPVDLNKLVRETLMLLGGQLSRSKIRVRTRLVSKVPKVMGDPVALEQALMNLLVNAQEAMPEGGSVEIASETTLGSPEHVRLMVADNGPGIAAENLSRLFDFLYTSKPDGSGLGLWLTRRIMREHHGEVEVRSEKGKGAIFILSFPLLPT